MIHLPVNSCPKTSQDQDIRTQLSHRTKLPFRSGLTCKATNEFIKPTTKQGATKQQAYQYTSEPFQYLWPLQLLHSSKASTQSNAIIFHWCNPPGSQHNLTSNNSSSLSCYKMRPFIGRSVHWNISVTITIFSWAHLNLL